MGLTEFLAGRPEALDLLVSADTLCYFGALEAVFAAAAAALRPRGLFAFTLERAASGEEEKGLVVAAARPAGAHGSGSP